MLSVDAECERSEEGLYAKMTVLRQRDTIKGRMDEKLRVWDAKQNTVDQTAKEKTEGFYPKGFGFYLMEQHSAVSMSKKRNKGKVEEIYTMIMQIPSEQIQDKLLCFLDDYRTQLQTIESFKHERQNLLKSVIQWMEADSDALARVESVHLTFAMAVEEEFKDSYNERLSTMEKLQALKKQMELRKKRLEKVTSGELYQSGSDSPETDQSTSEDTDDTIHSDDGWLGPLSDTKKLIMSCMDLDNQDELNNIILKLEELTNWMRSREQEIKSRRDAWNDKRKDRRELQAKTARLKKDLAKDQEHVRQLEEDLDILKASVPPKVLQKYKKGQMTLTAEKGQVPEEERGTQTSPDIGDVDRASKDVSSNAPLYSENVPSEDTSYNASPGPENEESDRAVETPDQTRRRKMNTTPPPRPASKPKPPKEPVEAGTQSEDMSETAPDEDLDPQQLQDILTQHIKYSVQSVSDLTTELLALRENARVEIKNIKDKVEGLVKLEKKMQKVMHLVDEHEQAIPFIDAEGNVIKATNRVQTFHKCRVCLCQDTTPANALASFDIEAGPSVALIQCVQYQSMLENVRAAYRQLYTHLEDCHAVVSSVLTDDLVWGELGTSDYTSLDPDKDREIEDRLESSKDVPKKENRLLSHAIFVSEHLSELVKALQAILHNSKIRMVDVMSQEESLLVVQRLLYDMRFMMDDAALRFARLRARGRYLETERILGMCVCPYCKCYNSMLDDGTRCCSSGEKKHEQTLTRSQALLHQAMASVLRPIEAAEGKEKQMMSAISPEVVALVAEAISKLTEALSAVGETDGQ